MMKHFAIGLLAAVCISLAAKHDNAFLNKVTNDYVTPHYKFQLQKDTKLLKPLFLLMRDGARDGVEVNQRMPMDITYFMVEGIYRFALEDMYGLKIDEVDGEVCLRLDKSDYSTYTSMDKMLRAWLAEAKKLESGESTKEQYDDWRYKYPELDTPVLKGKNNSH